MSSRSTGNPPETDFQWWSFLRKSWSDHFGSGKLSSFDTNLKTLIWQKQFCHSWSLESLFEAFDDYTFDKAVEKRVIGNYVTFDHSNTFFITTWGLFRVFLNNSQCFPSLSSGSLTGLISVIWHHARLSNLERKKIWFAKKHLRMTKRFANG